MSGNMGLWIFGNNIDQGKPRSILLPQIYKTPYFPHHRYLYNIHCIFNTLWVPLLKHSIKPSWWGIDK